MSKHVSRFRSLRGPIVALAVVSVAAGGLAACGSDSGSDSGSDTAARSSVSPTASAGLHMIDVRGHTMAFHVIPGHLPALVLDAGGGMDSSEWKKVAPELAAKTGSEVISYDRAGEGRSSEVPGPWRASDAAADLEAGLTKLGVTKDVVLVSHSLAGEVAFSFVRSHPHQVAGAVLVDANLPQFFTPEETARLVAMNQRKVKALRKKPSTKKTRQLLAEATNYGPVHDAYHKLSWPSGVPATVIVSATTPFPTAHDARLWRKAQREFADAAKNRKLVHAAHSSHDVPEDRPDVVVDTVTRMAKRVG